jgi:hypothetical protein
MHLAPPIPALTYIDQSNCTIAGLNSSSEFKLLLFEAPRHPANKRKKGPTQFGWTFMLASWTCIN